MRFVLTPHEYCASFNCETTLVYKFQRKCVEVEVFLVNLEVINQII